MASAGRILIMPKGNYDSSVTYEMLDLVFNKGASWLAKKTVVGIEPSDDTSEHWFKMCASTDLTELLQRIAALEAQMLGTISLDDIDLSGYALKTELANYATKAELYTVNLNLNGLDGRLDTIEPTVSSLVSSMASVSGVKFYTGTLDDNGTNRDRRVPCSFPPKLVFVIGRNKTTTKDDASVTIAIPDSGFGSTFFKGTDMLCAPINVTRSGNDVILSYNNNENMQPTYACYNAQMTYKYLCIG